MKKIFYLRGKILLEPMTKNAPSNSKENPQKSQRGKNQFRHTKPGKRVPSDMQKNNSIKVKIFSPNPPA